jgi:hypothetical protein
MYEYHSNRITSKYPSAVQSLNNNRAVIEHSLRALESRTLRKILETNR